MSLAYYIVLDQQNPGFAPFVNGKSLAGEARRVNKAAKKLGLRRLDDFVSYDEEPAAELLGVETDVGPWFGADEGVAWVSALLERFRRDPKPLKDPAGVIADLEECLGVLQKAQGVGARWHFAIDF